MDSVTKEQLIKKAQEYRAIGDQYQRDAIANFGAADGLLKMIAEMETTKQEAKDGRKEKQG